jgi:hypothetical protein
MLGSRCLAVLLPFILLSLVLAKTGRATTLAHMSIEQMAAGAQAIARLRCVGNSTRWEGGEIWTVTTFEVQDVWKGTLPARIAVHLLGGRHGPLTSHVAGIPRFVANEEVVLFLEPTRDGDFSVTSWAQGTFRIQRDPGTGGENVTQDTAGYLRFGAATGRFTGEGIRGVPLDELRRRVLAATQDMTRSKR